MVVFRTVRRAVPASRLVPILTACTGEPATALVFCFDSCKRFPVRYLNLR